MLPTRDCGPDHANTVELCVGDPEDEQNAASGDSGGPLFIIGVGDGEGDGHVVFVLRSVVVR